MIRIISKNTLKDGKRDEFLKITKELIEKTRKEDGCIAYHLFEDINNPLILTFVEDWRDEEAIKNHNNTEHFKRIVPQFGDLRVGKSDLNKYTEV
ncbi:antibiotic biosynthesis monooxygenase [Clostridium carboxidivorans P7]|uniref:Antibiotic biosynthesis monooxygenase n=1 Tax=Clostridium carboxidivorans P7 TaxID=536227 RepID=C6Q191_9CLOT|nr:putative quinol monooxygenase [Clostridium carboxidivorans]AKN30381.1 antibiotic biosynthesis monooxygenase [Clostridium carboxidivorans P7]EET84729.1 Antibiotic biosynthesis monooxygenase [Clostridium carboxidivorans P7]